MSSHQQMELISVNIIVLVVFFIVVVFQYVQHRLWLYETRAREIEYRLHQQSSRRLFARRNADAIQQRQAGASTQPNSTEDQEASSAANTVTYKDIIKMPDEADWESCCAICIEEFEEEEICGVVESCGHCFHKDCMDQWLRIQSRCPLCRCLVHVVTQNNNTSPEDQV